MITGGGCKWGCLMVGGSAFTVASPKLVPCVTFDCILNYTFLKRNRNRLV